MSVNDKIKKLVVEWETERLKEYCRSILKNNEATASGLLKIIGDIMKFVGNQFEEEEIFLPELIGSAETVKAVIDEVLDPAIRASGEEKKSRGKIVIGTVESDVHSIGKNIVAMMMKGNGWEVTDMGVDVSPEEYCSAIEKNDCQILGLSSLLTTTMPSTVKTINALKAAGLRSKVKIMVGGAPTTQEWANKIGADGYAPDASSAVRVAKVLIGKA